MKTLTKSLFAVALSAVVFTTSAMAVSVSEPVVKETKVTALSSVNRIWVSGNVKLVLTQGDTPSIVGSENYSTEKTFVKTNGKTLYVNSMEQTQVTLYVTLQDLERVEAHGQSVVETKNNFDVKNLQLFLTQSATAKIKTNAASLYTVVQEDAVLKLNGKADDSTLIASNMKNVKLNDFATLRSSSYASEAIMKAEQTAMTLAK